MIPRSDVIEGRGDSNVEVGRDEARTGSIVQVADVDIDPGYVEGNANAEESVHTGRNIKEEDVVAECITRITKSVAQEQRRNVTAKAEDEILPVQGAPARAMAIDTADIAAQSEQ